MAKIKYLVTGGVGFIGNCFCKLLLREKQEISVINVDCCTYAANIKTISEELKDPRYKFYNVNICDKTSIDKIFKDEKPDIVINFAAETHVDKSFYDEDLFFETNVLGTKVLLDACKKYGIKRFHQISTDEVYGDVDFSDDRRFDELSILNPSSPYAKSKAEADRVVLEYYQKFGLPISISRSTNNYGPYQFPEKLIPLMISFAKKDEPLPVYGNGENVRNWLYVEDNCRAILSIIEKGKVGNIYNISSNDNKKNIEVVKTILSYMKESKSTISFVKDRKNHDKKYSINSDKIVNDLGWKPAFQFESKIADIISWYIDNDEWLRDCELTNNKWIEINYFKRKN